MNRHTCPNSRSGWPRRIRVSSISRSITTSSGKSRQSPQRTQRKREHAINLYKKGIDVAAALGSPTARCDPGTVNLDDPAISVESYKTLVAYGTSKGVRIIVENHGGISQHPEVLVKILQASGAGALPDVGNFPDNETRFRGLRLMYPLAAGVSHAKLNPRFDLSQCVQIAKEAGYHGVFSVEAGGCDEPYQGVQRILDALVSSLA